MPQSSSLYDVRLPLISIAKNGKMALMNIYIYIYTYIYIYVYLYGDTKCVFPMMCFSLVSQCHQAKSR